MTRSKRAIQADKAILAIGDLHHPFAHPDALTFATAVYERFCLAAAASEVVSVGDEVDAHAFSDKHRRDPDGMSEGEEWQAAVFGLQPWMKTFPRMKICTSNHTARPEIRSFNAGLPRAFFRSVKEAMGAPDGWHWNNHFEIDGIIFEHGEGVSGAAGALRAAERNRKSTVIGHLHGYGGVQWSHGRFSSIFGFNLGCLIDSEAYAFRYAAKLRTTPSIGIGVIVDGVPFWIPMNMNSKGRWTGKFK